MKACLLLSLAASLILAAFLAAQELIPPAAGRSAKTALNSGAGASRGESPLSGIHTHVCGFHFYNGDMGRQVAAHHYCAHLSEDLMQCVIYDSDRKDARLIGIEYIVSAKLFKTLPKEEKIFWHSHNYEVKSGQLTAPELPGAAEKELMKDLVGTYGKTIHTWQVDRNNALPLGTPQLMMGFTADGQADQALLDARDQAYGITTREKKASRAGIPSIQVDPAADAWKTGDAEQLRFQNLDVPNSKH